MDRTIEQSYMDTVEALHGKILGLESSLSTEKARADGLEKELAKAREEIEILKMQLASADEGLRQGPRMQVWLRAENAEKERDTLRASNAELRELLKLTTGQCRYWLKTYRSHTGAMNATHLSEKETLEKVIEKANALLAKE